MRVIATAVGFHGALRQVGDEFEVPDGEKSSWFVQVNANAGKRGKAKPEAEADAPAGDLA